eukprot:GFUD01000513.1.p1 GENE.GFUD01000513.1~~GFUD01000513.1.p1  ORF type:complete len:134 (+),score=43.46 GFUD01000513.1:58-459(+)
MPHICGPHSNLPNCRYYDQYTTEQNPNWVPAAGTGTMDKQKKFPRLQMNQRWEPKSNNEEPEKEKEPKEIPIQIERGPAVRQGDEDNWAGKKKSAYIRPQGSGQVEGKIYKQDQAPEENIFPRKRRSDLKPNM